MVTGTVIWLHPTGGFGFIKPDVSDSNLYVHTMRFVGDSVTAPRPGQRVTFELDDHQGKPTAVNLQTIYA